MGSPIPENHAQKKTLLLFSTVPVSSAASSNSPSNRSIEDFRFLFPINPATALLQPHQAIPHRVEALNGIRFSFPINPATALRIHLPTTSITIGN
jgi:hypothetical protein